MIRNAPQAVRSLGFWLSLLALIFVGTIIVFLLSSSLPGTTGMVDLAEYWAAARLLLKGQNPYDAELIFRLQQHYLPFSEAIRMWNPPVIFPFIFWFGWIDLKLLTALWFVLSLALIVAVFASIVETRPEDSTYRRICWIFLLTFYPMVDLLSWGQISSLLLVSFALYLRFSQRKDRKSQFIAGAAFSATLIKPHVLYLVFLYVFIRSICTRHYSVLLGFAIASSALIILPLLFQPEVLRWYLDALQTPPIHFRTPTLGSWLQGFTGIHSPLVRIAPTLIFIVLTLVSFLRYPQLVRSKNTLYALAPLSLFSSPYGWGYDQILLLPTALHLISVGLQIGGKWIPLLVGIPLLANIILFLTPAELGQEYVIWYPMVLAICALLSLRLTETLHSSSPEEAI